MKRAISYKKSSRKTETGCFNNFDSSVIDTFVRLYKPEFIDMTGPSFNYWQNCNDTMVIKMPNLVGWDIIGCIDGLHADEFDWENLDSKHVVVRLWWD